MSSKSGPGYYSPGDAVGNAIYEPFLNGGFKNNPARNRFTLMNRMYERILTELAISRFKWHGFPESVQTRYLELTLFRNALSVFYWDDRYDKFFALSGSPAGMVNMVQDPTAFNVIGNQFISQMMPADDVVPIWANMLRMPELDILLTYAPRLADIDHTIEINAHNARHNKFVWGEENARLSVMNITRMFDQGDNVIPVTSEGIMQQVGTVDLGIDPDHIEKLHILKVRQWNECLQLLGINGSNQDKKERLVSDEVGANDDQVASTRRIALKSRKLAAEQINRRWPSLNVQVEFDYDAVDDLVSAFSQQIMAGA